MKLLRYIVKVASTLTFVSILGFNIQFVVPQQCEELRLSNSSDLEIQCPDVNDECTWFRIENGSQVSVESRFTNLNNNNITLQGNDRYGYGLFNVSTSQSDSFCYKVCPVDSEHICENCSDIVIDSTTNPPEVELCVGENISIAIIAPPIFNISDYFGASLRLNGSNLGYGGKCCPIGNVRVPSVIYQCENMEEIDSGSYSGHNLVSCAGDIILEWCTQYVSIKVKNCSNDTNDSSSPTTTIVPQTSSHSIYNNISTESLSITSMELTISITTSILAPTTSSTPKASDNGGENIGQIIGFTVAGVVIAIATILAVVIIGCILCHPQWRVYNVEEMKCKDQKRNRQSAVTSPTTGLEESNI